MRKSLLSLASATLISAASASAQAQVGMDPTPPPPAPVETSSPGGAGARGLGVGIAQMLNGPGGLSVAYDMGMWHLDGILFFEDRPAPIKADFGLAGRFFYHLASGSAADFSIGGGLGYRKNGGRELGGMTVGDSDVMSIEGGLLIRAFIAPNVAASVFGGLSVLTADGEGVMLNGQPLGQAGLHYFF
jgi:hypothetical protein